MKLLFVYVFCFMLIFQLTFIAAQPAYEEGDEKELSVEYKEKTRWGESRNIDLIFKNNGNEAICRANFRIDSTAITGTWNMIKINDQEYSLPGWFELKPGAEYRDSGFIQSNGPVPKVEVLSHEYC
ncbi:hypothetical protein FO519_009729 [Halicephalobus sp. NKZ332]|nr:hypothetical protein FO519_009729 [Halicephalobus sp. NKZ332]